MISKNEITTGLPTRFFGHTVYPLQTVDSTNDYAKRLTERSVPHGAIVIAEQQTGGRGRLGRSWVSEEGANLLFSVILRPTFSLEKVMILPFVAAVAVADAISQEFGIDLETKWPNDLLLDGKKICGILTESMIANENTNFAVIGIGVNVNQTSFPEELQEIAGSLCQFTGEPVDRISLLRTIIIELERRYDQLARFHPSRILDDWKNRTQMFGKKISISTHDGILAGIATGITGEGALCIMKDDGEKATIFSGDVTLAEENSLSNTPQF